MVNENFRQVLEKYHQALDELVKGNAEAIDTIFSKQDDATLANPFGGIMQGCQSVADTVKTAASVYREGTGKFKTVTEFSTGNLAYVVELEDYNVKISGRTEATALSFRATSIFRLEDDQWKLVHRHADPLVAVRPAESMMKEEVCIGSRCYF